MNPSRVTWLVLGTTMVLVSAVLVAAVFFINIGTETFPRGGSGGGSGVAQVGSIRARTDNPDAGRANLATSTGRHVAAQPAATGVAASLPPAGPGPSTRDKITSPTGHQYADSLQQLRAALGPR